MTRTRCPSCICEFDGTTDREGVPSNKTIQNMTLDSLIKLMDTLGVTYNPDGTQKIVLGGNLDSICKQTRLACTKKIDMSRLDIARILGSRMTEEVGC